jgi:hypothetical protein
MIGYESLVEGLKDRSRPGGNAAARLAKAMVLRAEGMAYGARAYATTLRRDHSPLVRTDLAELCGAVEPGRVFAVTPSGLRIDNANQLSALRVGPAELQHRVERDAVFVPAGDLGTHRGGGIYRRSGDLVPESVITRAGEQVTVPRRVLPTERASSLDAVVYVGSIFTQYGHLLTESMARLWYALDERPDLPIVCHGRNAVTVDHVRRVVSALGIRDRLLPVTRPTTFREVHIPEPSFVLKDRAHPRHLEVTRRIAERALGGRVPPTTQQPLYLSRARLRPEHRSMYGERTLLRHLERAGVKIIDPQLLDLDEQIRLVHHHEVVLGPMGSAHFSALLTLEPRSWVSIAPIVTGSLLLVAALTGNTTHCLVTAPLARSFQTKRNPVVDVALTMAALREIGVIP